VPQLRDKAVSPAGEAEMSESSVLQLVSTTGAAAALLYVLYLIVSGKLHTDSEVDALNEVIAKLETMNKTVVDQLKQTNDIFEATIERVYDLRLEDARGTRDAR
jgi:hypothetical protein